MKNENQTTGHHHSLRTWAMCTLFCAVGVSALNTKMMNAPAEKSVAPDKTCMNSYAGNGVQSMAAEMRKKKKTSVDTTATKKDSLADYKKLLKDAQTKEGLFTTHLTKESKLYWEMPDSAFKHYYLLANRVAGTSDAQDFVAGQMVGQPKLLRFTKDNQRVYMHLVQTMNTVDDNDPISSSFDKNNTDPILKGFKIAAKKGSSVVIDVTDFFGGNESSISPITQSDPMSALLGGRKSPGGSFMSDASGITSVKSFPQNIEIKSTLAFKPSGNDDPYTVQMHRSFFVLPDKPMRLRYYDTRVGTFFTARRIFDSKKDNVELRGIVHRWRIEPKPEDRERYFRGELVEPQKQIVFYVDSAFPAKWRSTIHQGIEDWNKAFEKAGFKNVVRAKDYPKNDPDFDPDDMRYNCVKYAVTETANAMGPSYVDPRSGEILNADVIWYHNVVSLLHNWRFVQTAAVDPRTHAAIFPDDLMCESIRYAIAHEVGHTMGLMHNMGASYAFPVDSLRNPHFTQQYGTTPSIMDYARNNYIAQPGDKERGVKLTPPVLGVYDMYAINWSYRLIKDAATPLQEIPTLNKWIDEKKGNPMFEFGAQQFLATIDPTDQSEDLGNDHIKAGNYAISNLKVIMKNLYRWTYQPGERYDDMQTMYKEIVKQYSRHIIHVIPYLGGVVFHDNRQGQDGVYRTYFNKKQQHDAMCWLVDQARTYDSWLTPLELTNKLFMTSDENSIIRTGVISSLFEESMLCRIREAELINPTKNYKLSDYLNDVVSEVFRPTIQNKKLTSAEMVIQSTALDELIKSSGLKLVTGRARSLVSDDCPFERFAALCASDELPCSHIDGECSFIRVNSGLRSLPVSVREPLMAAQLHRLQNIYRQRLSSPDKETAEFYRYQLMKINLLFEM